MAIPGLLAGVLTGTESVVSFGAFTNDTYNEFASMLVELSSLGLTGSADALDPHHSTTYTIESTGVDAMTLAAPTTGSQNAGGDSGRIIRIISNGAHAHTLTATGLLLTGSASVNEATFAAFAGAGLTLRALKGKWAVVSSIGITFS